MHTARLAKLPAFRSRRRVVCMFADDGKLRALPVVPAPLGWSSSKLTGVGLVRYAIGTKEVVSPECERRFGSMKSLRHTPAHWLPPWLSQRAHCKVSSGGVSLWPVEGLLYMSEKKRQVWRLHTSYRASRTHCYLTSPTQRFCLNGRDGGSLRWRNLISFYTSTHPYSPF